MIQRGHQKRRGMREYVKNGRKEKVWQRVARHRWGKGMKERLCWKGEEEKKCRICLWEVED